MKRTFLKLGVLGLIMVTFSLNRTYGQSDNKSLKQKPPSVEAVFEMMDADNDSKLSLEEVKGPFRDDFTKVDTNSDGFLTKEELEKVPKPERSTPRGREMFKDLDTDKDGKIALSEAKGRLKDNFSKVDANSDGYVTKEELEKVPKQRGDRKPMKQN